MSEVPLYSERSLCAARRAWLSQRRRHTPFRRHPIESDHTKKYLAVSGVGGGFGVSVHDEQASWSGIYMYIYMCIYIVYIYICK